MSRTCISHIMRASVRPCLGHGIGEMIISVKPCLGHGINLRYEPL
ncbi:Hemicentin-1 [Gossypium arboreum]|uniref:Hemicentin-1 n=1 Tax=Gossypium arboreum TaxID=29729 RepID=A0A0B0PV83_GOSAR|nr:Hemicentin-1 [Gossypium arboreum]